MAHNHENCTRPTYGNSCVNGVLWGSCDFEGCDNLECEELGHCKCKCHTGKTCKCGKRLGEE